MSSDYAATVLQVGDNIMGRGRKGQFLLTLEPSGLGLETSPIGLRKSLP